MYRLICVAFGVLTVAVGWEQGQDCLVAVYKGDAAPSGRSKKPAPQVVIVDARKLARNASSPSTAPTVAPRVHALKEAPHTHGSGPSAVSALASGGEKMYAARLNKKIVQINLSGMGMQVFDKKGRY